MERSGTLISAYQPESDLTALMERYRTGPFRPEAQVYESIAHDEADAVFGIDLRREGAWRVESQDNDGSVALPPVITALLKALDEAYKQLPTDIGEFSCLHSRQSFRLTLTNQKSAKHGFTRCRWALFITCVKS